jgi:hypothetical protein
MPTVSELQMQLRTTRRELTAARLALLARRVAQERPQSSEDTVRALSVVLQHGIPSALSELRAERDRLARDLGSVLTCVQAARNRSNSLRYDVWRLAQQALVGNDVPEAALEAILAETLESDEEDGWVE